MQKFDMKTLYFVLASLLGLLMLVMGIASASNTALEQYVFKPKSQTRGIPPEPFISSTVKQLEEPKIKEELTPEQKAALEQWRLDYAAWQEEQKNFDWEAENRKRSLSFALSMIIAGGPVFLIHAPFVFKRS